MVEKEQLRCSKCGAYFTSLPGAVTCPSCSKK